MPACSMAAARVQLWRAPAATAAAARPPPRLHAAAAAPVPRRVHAAAIICTASARSVICSTAAGGYQRPLTNQERKAQRAAAQRLGRQLITVSLGQKGLTPTFLEGFRLAMGANALVKVRVGSCDESIEEVAEALGAAGDCELVHKIGFTLTFYRDPSLPPPPPYRPSKAAAAAALGAAEAAEEALSDHHDEEECDSEFEDSEEVDPDAQEIDSELAEYLMENEDAYSDSDSEGEEEGGAAAAAGGAAPAQRRKPPPPEFTVIG